ncbi:MAG: fluoride efflux transporter CrcB [Ferruginibacter sp.]
MIRSFLLIGLGGALGTMLRFGTSLLIGFKSYPLATLLVNVAGSFIIGLVMAYSLKSDSFALNWRLFLATGLCGGFTTFSAFSLENLLLLQNGKLGLFVLYAVGSLVLGIAAVWAGFKIIAIT